MLEQTVPASPEVDFQAPVWGEAAPRGGKAVLNRIIQEKATVPLFFGQTLISSLRDVGYNSTTSALCEHVDNAIQWGATEVRVYFRQTGKIGNLKTDVLVLDNGSGMAPNILKFATSFGGSMVFDNRSGIGRYGMGMKTAALSMSPVMDLYSWQEPGAYYNMTLDVEAIGKEKSNLIQLPDPTLMDLLPSELSYRSRGQRADYVHSREDSAANERVMQKLENHQLDVIVQVRKLGEGFDHPLLAVAAVFSIFRNLSPFVQFVGRIMRVIEHDAPGHPLNNGVVVFHAGANIASRWEDFQEYSEADREYFDQLLPMEGLDFSSGDELQIDPNVSRQSAERVDVRSQTDVRLQEIPLIQDDAEALAALKILQGRGYTSDQVKQAYEELQPVPVTKVRQRQAKRASLDMRVKTEAARILHDRKLNPEGHDLDRQRLGRSNLIVLKAGIDRQVNTAVGRKPGERSDFSRPQLEQIEKDFAAIVEKAVEEVFNAGN